MCLCVCVSVRPCTRTRSVQQSPRKLRKVGKREVKGDTTHREKEPPPILLDHPTRLGCCESRDKRSAISGSRFLPRFTSQLAGTGVRGHSIPERTAYTHPTDPFMGRLFVSFCSPRGCTEVGCERRAPLLGRVRTFRLAAMPI